MSDHDSTEERGPDSETTDGPIAVGPHPDHSPEAVVRDQIRVITEGTTDRSNEPNRTADTGEQAETDQVDTTSIDRSTRFLFALATPALRGQHGSLEAFARAMSTPIYQRLLEASEIERGPITIDEQLKTARQTTLAKHSDGDRTYEFVLNEQTGGKYDGCWMIDRVSLVYDGVSPSFRRMPTVTFGDVELKCDEGDRLRNVLLRASGYSPHNDVAQVANCGGNGLCGTCAVEVCGSVSEQQPRERARLELPPHNSEQGLRLSCQTRVIGDVVVRKHDGLWGQHVDTQVDSEAEPEASESDPIAVTQTEYDGTYNYGRQRASGGADSDNTASDVGDPGAGHHDESSADHADIGNSPADYADVADSLEHADIDAPVDSGGDQ